MSIWISILLAILPRILDFLLKWFAKDGKFSLAQAEQLNYAIADFHEIEGVAVKMGCKQGGVKRPYHAEPSVWQDAA